MNYGAIKVFLKQVVEEKKTWKWNKNERWEVGAPYEMPSTKYLKDTDSDESFGQSFGGNTGPELVGCSSVREKRGEKQRKS